MNRLTAPYARALPYRSFEADFWIEADRHLGTDLPEEHEGKLLQIAQGASGTALGTLGN
jgi:hypothetical protein